MKPITQLLSCSFFTLAALIISCSDDEPGALTSTGSYQAKAVINPSNFPNGAGLSLSESDTGRVAQLDDEASFPWDILFITYRTAEGGRPAAILYGDTEMSGSVEGLNISDFSNDISLGATGFEAFTEISPEMEASLQPDGPFDIDQVEKDEDGMPILSSLITAYEALIIGNPVFNFDEADQPVYLIKSRSGDLYKFQLVSLESGGNITLRWGKFN